MLKIDIFDFVQIWSAFQVLTVIYFTSFIISILYYWGAMQWFVQKLGAPLRLALGTTVCESMATASNIFFGLSDTTLMVRPFIKVFWILCYSMFAMFAFEIIFLICTYRAYGIQTHGIKLYSWWQKKKLWKNLWFYLFHYYYYYLKLHIFLYQKHKQTITESQATLGVHFCIFEKNCL